MTIYLEKGFTSKRLEQVETPPIQYLLEYTPDEIKRIQTIPESWENKLKNKMQGYDYSEDEWKALAYLEYRKQDQRYFTSGHIEPNDRGTIKRGNDTLIRRDLFILDYDALDCTYDEFIETIQHKLNGIECIVYPTLKYTDKYPRLRLVIPIDRPLLQYEYQHVLKEIVKTLPFEYDHASFTWAQCMGLPIITPLNRHVGLYHQEGGHYPTPIHIEPPTRPTFTAHQMESTLKLSEAVKIVQEYTEWDKENLLEYTKALHAILVIAKTYQEGGIDLETAYQCVEVLALGNKDWEEGNRNILRVNLEKPIRTNWTFKSKFTDLRSRPNTLKDLYKRLALRGDEWRDEHSSVNEKTGEVKRVPVNARSIANILKQECRFILIDESDPELALLAVYDLDGGIYRKGKRFMNKLILSVEATSTKHTCDTVLHFLEVESPLVERTKEKGLIVFNNGIFDKSAGTLVPFTPDYVFTSKINVNYNPTATVEPVFDGWQFSEWLKTMAGEDEEKHLILWQVIANALDSNSIPEVSIFFYSREGLTGKSTFQALLSSMVGKDNVASLKINEFENPFKLASAYGKSLIIGDDNHPRAFHESNETFKSVVTGDNVLLNPKHDKPFLYYFNALVIQSMNGLPRFADVSHGMLRRIRIVEFNQQFTGANRNRRVKEAYIHDPRLHEYIALKALEIESDSFTNTEESKRLLMGIELDNNPVLDFYESVVKEMESTRLPTKFLFYYFTAWCKYEVNAPTKMKQRTFTAEMKSIMEKDGWRYERMNLSPLGELKKQDLDGYESLAYRDGYHDFEAERFKSQPLFYLKKPTTQQ